MIYTRRMRILYVLAIGGPLLLVLLILAAGR